MSARTINVTDEMPLTTRNPLLEVSEALPAYEERMSLASIDTKTVADPEKVDFAEQREENIKNLNEMALEIVKQTRGGSKESKDKPAWI